MKKRYWYVILTYIIMQLSSLILIPLHTKIPINPYTLQVYWSVSSFILGLIIVLWLMKPDMRARSNGNAANWGIAILWIVGGLIMAYIFQGVANVIEVELLGIEQESENTEMIMNFSKISPLFIIIPALIAPILEEIIFRKIIFGVLYKRMNFFFAALISALIFAIIHGEPEHTLIYASMGFVFAFVYVKTKRILVPILVHIAMNSLAVLISLLIPPEKLEEMTQQVINMYLILIGG